MSNIIIFDLDNTFYEYENCHDQALVEVFKNQKIYDNFDEFMKNYESAKNLIQNRLFSSPSKHSKLLYFKQLFENKKSLQTIVELENIYWDTFIRNAEIDNKVLSLLKEIKLKNFKFILFTNQNTKIQLKKIANWNLDFFDKIITSEEVGYEKPQQEFFSYAKEVTINYHKDKGEIYAIGDDFKNDLSYWKSNFDATIYLIDNKLKDNVYKLNETEDIPVETSNFKTAIYDIYNKVNYLK